ncbi:hypothetical protein J1C56_24575 [Aminobacter anthyllidis]|jgi:TM2 domain-containing membrane protein YozV|uniref:Uncharacterized protein n=1 Tax=Aminobacter anthyllidis TaxID=1035067 RepID=A0A9X1AFM2_9HYPH|nr:hypothetical protein [Aminobacter anthyllidis]MBT1158752.1 hypothetical protein [Aminobacter anthyllidis]MDH4988209.1 hypothetical protein [Aminobacter anthyllidis]
MDTKTRHAAVAAAWIMIIFGVAAFYLPKVMLAVGDYSTVAAGVVAVLFVLGFFGVFWLRGRSQRNKNP